MLGAVLGLPQQLAQGWAAARELALPDGCCQPGRVLAAGMGGSAIAADLAAGLLADGLRAPVVVWRDYGLPGWVGPGTLVAAASHSGDTAETLTTFEAAAARGAARVAITTGGRLAVAARAAGVPLVQLPAGGQPRAALGRALGAMLGVLFAAQVVPDPGQELATATELMAAVTAADGADGPAAQLAGRLVGRLPLIWAPERMAAVARRWKTQINENAKAAAAWDTLPELHHNTIEGLNDGAALGQQLHIVLLTAAGAPDHERHRLAVTLEVLDGARPRADGGHGTAGTDPGPGVGVAGAGRPGERAPGLCLRRGPDPGPDPAGHQGGVGQSSGKRRSATLTALGHGSKLAPEAKQSRVTRAVTGHGRVATAVIGMAEGR